MKFDKKRVTDENEDMRIFNNGKATTTNFVLFKNKQLIFKTYFKSVYTIDIFEDIMCVM